MSGRVIWIASLADWLRLQRQQDNAAIVMMSASLARQLGSMNQPQDGAGLGERGA